MAVKTKMLKQLSAAYLLRDKAAGFNNTLNGGASSVAGVSSLQFSVSPPVNTPLRYGSGETLELINIASVTGAGPYTATLSAPTVYDHPVNETVVEQIAYDLGDIMDDGVNIAVNGDTTDIQVATKRLVYNVLNGYAKITAGLSLPGVSLNNLVVALGVPFTSVAGAGTTASPYNYATDGSDFASETNMSLVVLSVLQDGTFLREELWGVDMDYTGIQMAMSRGKATPLALKFVASSALAVYSTTIPFTPSTVNRAGKGKVFDYLSEVGLFTTAAGSTLASQAAAGSVSVTMVSGIPFSTGQWVKFGSGDTAEYHQIDSIAGAVINLRSKLLRTQAAGTITLPATEAPFGAVSEDGVTLSVGGSVEDLRVATRRIQVGVRPGSAAVQAGFGVTDITLANFAAALGIPASLIANNRLVVGSAVGTQQQDGVYLKGFLQDGTLFRIVFWGCSADVSSFAQQLASKGVATLPMSFKPSSGVLFLQN